MAGDFERFLISVDDANFQLIASTGQYIHVDKLFVVEQIVKKNAPLNINDGISYVWEWVLTLTAYNMLGISKDIVLPIVNFPSWTKARDDCLKFLSKHCPEQTFNTTMKKSINPFYRCIIQERNLMLNFHNATATFTCKNNWSVNFNNTLSYQEIKLYEPKLFSQKFITRKHLLQTLHDFVSTYLYALYKANPLQYHQERKELLDGKDYFDIWWMSFVKLDIDLHKIFDAPI